MGVECALPGKIFIFGELVATARVLKRDLAGAHRGQDRGFATDRPSFAVWRRQFSAHQLPQGRTNDGIRDEPRRGFRRFESAFIATSIGEPRSGSIVRPPFSDPCGGAYPVPIMVRLSSPRREYFVSTELQFRAD